MKFLTVALMFVLALVSLVASNDDQDPKAPAAAAAANDGVPANAPVQDDIEIDESGVVHKIPDHHELVKSGVKCGKGTHLKRNPKNNDIYCEECPDGTYIDYEIHANTSCKSCYDKPSSAMNYEIYDCIDKTQPPSLMACKAGWRLEIINVTHTKCVQCSSCRGLSDTPYVGHQCTNKTDIVCCPRPNMVVNFTGSTPICLNSTDSAENVTVLSIQNEEKAEKAQSFLLTVILPAVLGGVVLVIIIIVAMCCCYKKKVMCFSAYAAPPDQEMQGR